MYDDDVDVDESADDESSESHRGGFFESIGNWLSGKPNKQADDEESEAEKDIKEARRRVGEYYSSGKDRYHREHLEEMSYRASPQYTIAAETEHLERHLAHYDEECQRFGSDAMLSQDLWEQRIARLNQAICETERIAQETLQSHADLQERAMNGEISEVEYADLFRNLCRKELRAGTRLGMAGLGGDYAEIGDVGDKSAHILDDALADGDGEMREQIFAKIRTMPRRMALTILEQAVADGVISEQTANYLRRRCIR